MGFPITDLKDEGACYSKSVAWLHAEGLAYLGFRRTDRMRAHRCHGASVIDTVLPASVSEANPPVPGWEVGQRALKIPGGAR